jgi:hypothetical protein
MGRRNRHGDPTVAQSMRTAANLAQNALTPPRRPAEDDPSARGRHAPCAGSHQRKADGSWDRREEPVQAGPTVPHARTSWEPKGVNRAGYVRDRKGSQARRAWRGCGRNRRRRSAKRTRNGPLRSSDVCPDFQGADRTKQGCRMTTSVRRRTGRWTHPDLHSGFGGKSARLTFLARR